MAVQEEVELLLVSTKAKNTFTLVHLLGFVCSFIVGVFLRRLLNLKVSASPMKPPPSPQVFTKRNPLSVTRSTSMCPKYIE